MKTKSLKLYYFILGIVCTLVLLFLFGNFFLPGNISSLTHPSMANLNHIRPPSIPEKLEFAGERIPTENFEVYERMEREFLSNTFWHSATILAIKRAARWFPVIEPILKKNGIPDDFKYLCVAESNLDNAVSPAGATGFWQFMEASGKKYGLEINEQIDERYHVQKSTEAACRYLMDSYNLLGSWVAAAASYNMGQDGIRKQRERQKAVNYFNLMLNQETYRFVGRIVSLKYILSDPLSFGFELNENDLYKPLEYYEITLNTAVEHFADFAAKYGVNYFILKMYNPWLRDYSLANKNNRIYTIKLPKEGSIKIIN